MTQSSLKQLADPLPREEATPQELALAELREAVEFLDRVLASSPEERAAVGSDHLNWLERAARQAAEFAPKFR